MRATRFFGMSFVFALVLASCWSAAAAQSGSAPHVTGYYVCEFDVSGPGGSSTVYLSDPIANTGFRPGPVGVAFRDFVNTTYHSNAKNTAACFESPTEAVAQQVIQSKVKSGTGVVRTGWKYTPGPTPAAAATPAASSSAPASTGSPSSAAAPNQATGGGQYVLCYSDASLSPFYLSADLHIDVPLPPDPHSPNSDGGASRRAIVELQNEFLAYLKADRGYQGTSSSPTTCSGRATSAEMAPMRQLLRERFPQLKFVETGWKPGVKPTATPKPSATPAASPVMNAPTPAPSAAKPAAATAKPSPTPAATPAASAAPTLYAYCYAYGSIAGASSTAKQHFYITQPFQAARGEQLNQAFESLLRTAHPGETISASCLSPGPLDAAQQNRQTTIELRRKQPTKWEVIDVDWKR